MIIVLGIPLGIMLAIGIIFVYVILCRFAYRCGTESGNLTVSIILLLFALTSIIGFCHLLGASRCKDGMGFDYLERGKRNSENERLKLEIASMKFEIENMKNQANGRG